MFEVGEHSQSRKLALVPIAIYDPESLLAYVKARQPAEKLNLLNQQMTRNLLPYMYMEDTLRNLPPPTYWTKTDSEGRFAMTLPPRKEFVLFAFHPGYGIYRGWVFRLPQPKLGTISISLDDDNLTHQPGTCLLQAVGLTPDELK